MVGILENKHTRYFHGGNALVLWRVTCDTCLVGVFCRVVAANHAGQVELMQCGSGACAIAAQAQLETCV
eukprot:2804322-Amphidinium_carterae.1